MLPLLPLQLVTVGVGLALYARREKTVKPRDKSFGGVEEANGDQPDGLKDDDFERSATQWLARSGALQDGVLNCDHLSSTYADIELLAEGDLVYIRSDGNILTALVPAARRLELQPLQLAKGKPDAVPTAPLESASVWVVRRWRQQVAFELHGPHNRRHVLEADPNAPHGVALGGGSAGRKGRWNITSPTGLTSARWPEHVLSLQVVPVQLVDARAVLSVKTSLGKKVAELTAKFEEEVRERGLAEGQRDHLEQALKTAKEAAAKQVAELQAQLDAAVRSRHAAEREVATLQGQRADEAVRTKVAQSRAAQVEHELQQSEATVRRQQQQIQGMLAGHAEELRTLQHELQIAREANEGLKRAMGEQVMSLQGALELRDARLLELEEENDRMDTVLQVIQTQLGGASSAALGSPGPGRGGSGSGDRPPLDSQAAGGGGAEEAGGPELSLSELVRQGPQAGGEEPAPLWRSLWDLTGDLTLTALKESLAISRRNTKDEAAPQDSTPAPTPEGQDALQANPQTPHATPQSRAETPRTTAGGSPGPSPARNGPQPWTLAPSPDGCSSVGSTGPTGVAAGEWGSGGESGSGLGQEDGEFISAAARMSGRLQSSSGGGSTATVAPAVMGSQPPRPLLQHQVVGAAGGVGCNGRAPEDERVAVEVAGAPGAGAGAASAPEVPPGGAATSSTPRSSAAVTPQAAPTLSTGGGGGPTPAQLEYGLEATLTLDSLRRRMRQLEAERDRLELLRTSLEESLPWRAAGGLAGEGRVSSCWTTCGGDAAATLSRDGAVEARRSEVGERTGRQAAGGVGREGGKEEGPLGPGMGTGGGIGVAGEPEAGSRQQRQQDQAEVVAGHQRHQPETETPDEWPPQEEACSSSSQQQHPRRRPRAARDSPEPTAAQAASSRREGQQGHRLRASRGAGAGGGQAVTDRSAASSACDKEPTAGSAGEVAEEASSSGRVRRIAQQLFGGEASGSSPVKSHGSPAESPSAGRAVRQRRTTGPSAPSPAPATSAVDGSAPSCVGMSKTPALPSEPATTNTTVGCGPVAGTAPSSDAVLPASVPPLVIARPAEALPPQWVTAPTATTTANTIITTASMAPPPAVAAGRRLPELRIDAAPGGLDGGLGLSFGSGFGVHDSIDSMCNLGSTRAMPSFRGGNGALTARRVGHSRQPSSGAVDPLVAAATGAATVAAAAGGMPPSFCSPPWPVVTTPTGATDATAAAPSPGGVAGGHGVGGGGVALVTTPKSRVSTPAGGPDAGAEDDAAVHCDDQELSPNPAVVLLGSLEQLRSAAAGGLGVPGGGPAGARLTALEEDEEDE